MPAGQRVARRREAHLRAVDEHAPLVVLVDAGEDLDQRRLAGAVVAEDARHLAGVRPGRETSFSATTLPKYLRDVLDLEQVCRRSWSRLASSRPRPPGPAADQRVEHDREERGSRPGTCTSSCESHWASMIPMLTMPSIAAPKKVADHRPVAAGQEAAADDGADDEDELEPDALLRLHRAELERLDDPQQRRGRRRHHEEGDLRPGDRDADVAGRDGVAARARRSSSRNGFARSHAPTIVSPIHQRTLTLKSYCVSSRTSRPAAVAPSRSPPARVDVSDRRLPVSCSVPAALTPWRTKNVASVTMKLGSCVLTTVMPLRNPIDQAEQRARAPSRARRSCRWIGREVRRAAGPSCRSSRRPRGRTRRRS